MAAKTRLSLDGYGARRAGSFAGKEASVVVETPVVTETRTASYWPGYIPPKKRRRKKPEPVPVEILVEQVEQKQEVKSVVFRPSTSPAIPNIQPLLDAIAAQADFRSKVVKEIIEELEEEEDVLFIVRHLQ